MTAIDIDVSTLVCECCGVRPPRAIVFERGGKRVTALCSFCEGLIESGSFRPDGVRPDGSPLYRQWHQTWTPGELVRP